jgi:hypothetical protein
MHFQMLLFMVGILYVLIGRAYVTKLTFQSVSQSVSAAVIMLICWGYRSDSNFMFNIALSYISFRLKASSEDSILYWIGLCYLMAMLIPHGYLACSFKD